MAILVTGGLGYIGSFIARDLVRQGQDVVIVDDLSTGFVEAAPSQASFVLGSIMDQKFMANMIREHKIDAIVHLAGKSIVSESMEKPLEYQELNGLGTIRLLATAADLGVKKFIFSSTAAVYGNHNVDLVDEELHCKPENPYGQSKLFAENGLKDHSVLHPEMAIVCLRYFNVAGASADGEIGPRTKNATSLIKVVAEAAAGKRKEVEIFGTDYPTPDGTCVRDFVHVEDVSRAHLQVLNWAEQNPGFEVFNIGYGSGFSVLEVIKTMNKISSHQIVTKSGPRRPGDPVRVLANGEKLKKATGWRPEGQDLSLICESAYKWERRNV